MDLTGKQVLVAGLGKSGIAAGALLKKMGCMVCLFDGNEKFDRGAWEKTYKPTIPLIGMTGWSMRLSLSLYLPMKCMSGK